MNRPPLHVLILSTLLAVSPPVFVSELWPEEGRPVFVTTGARLILREQPAPDSPVVARIRAVPGDTLAFDRTEYQTLVPGKVAARWGGFLEGTNYGPRSRLSKPVYYEEGSSTLPVRFERGDTLEYLQYRAEGTCFVRLHGDVLAIDERDLGDTTLFRSVSGPTVEWWIHVIHHPEGQGWLLTDTTAVTEIDRIGG